MASGLAALLDDVAAIAKVAAASLDDVTAAAGKAGSQALGVVVDDAAVTPSYAMGFTPDRELPIVAKIALGSLRNKFLILLPCALLLSLFAPWAVTPILMLGGCYLSFEAVEKLVEALGLHGHHDLHANELAQNSADLERQRVTGAIRTDLILSAEIMAITLASVSDEPFLVQAATLAVIAFFITCLVYGVVGLLVKMDDIGLHLSRRRSTIAQRTGRMLVRAMPGVLAGLATIGTAAMLWVGGGILVHGAHEFHVELLPSFVAGAAAGSGPVLAWLIHAAAAAIVGLLAGGAIVGALQLFRTAVPSK